MSPEMPQRSLSDEPWFVDLLAERGFAKSSPTTFVRGQASIIVEGTTCCVDPGNGERSWNTDFGGADRSAVKALLEQILATKAFKTEVDLAEERLEKQNLERALTGIAMAIKNGPDTGGAVQLRRFLWSLYNGHHLVNLWRMTCVLDQTLGKWVAEVCAGAFVGALKEDDIKRALLVAGEMQRWDEVEPSADQRELIREALDKVDSALRTLPPSQAHADLARVGAALHEAKEILGVVLHKPSDRSPDEHR